jgi:hypothetical protein
VGGATLRIAASARDEDSARFGDHAAVHMAAPPPRLDVRARCRIGGVEIESIGGAAVDATSVDGGFVDCALPLPLSHAFRAETHVGTASTMAHARVEISTDGTTWMRVALDLSLIPPPRIDAVVPVSLPAGGGQVVAVFGAGFLNDPTLTCRFADDVLVDAASDAQFAPAEWVSPSEVRCVAPAREPGLATLTLALTARSNVSQSSVREWAGEDDGVLVSFIDEPRLVSLAPAHGPTRGGTRVEIRGAGLVASPLT